MKRILALLAVLAAVTAGTATAGNQKGSIAVNAAASNLVYGGNVSFTYTAPDHIKGILGLGFRCYQNGVLVLNAGSYPIAPSYYLASFAYTGGAATCTAYLSDIYHGYEKPVVTVDFAIAG